MKKGLLLLFIFIYNSVLSQTFITNPEFPTENESIEITFNIKEMTNTSLLGYTGTLYSHTGVNTNLGTWKYVIESWANNTTQPSLTRTGTDLYKLIIDNPRNFYGITNFSEHITSLNFVLRSSDASKKTEDLFIPIYEEGFNIKLLDVESINFYPLLGERIDITAVTNGSDSLTVFLNNVQISKTISDTLSISFIADGSGRQWLKYIAKRNNNVYQDSVSFFIREPLTIEELPQGVKPGITYIDNNSVTLALFAPKKNFVYAIGDFNNWEFDPDSSSSWEFDEKYYFKLTPDSSVYWTTITNLTPNKEYRFQYIVDGNLKIADPYADKILEQEDSFIDNATYPNLIPYPTGKTFFSVSVFETGQQDFVWEAVDYIKPEKENLIIYELLIRDFVSKHNYKTLIDTLDYLENLGINAIELMPVNEFEGNESWGYNPSFYFAPDKYYGPKDDLKKFIDECHKRNIAVILDMVLNHTYGRSPFVRLYASDAFGPPTSENPWYNVNSPNQVFSWGYDLNHESIHTQKLVDRVNRYWLDEYKFDGFRFDFTKGFTNTPGDGGGFDQSRINLLKRMADSVWVFDPTAYLILEHFAPDSEEKILTDYGMMVWGNNNYNYSEASMGFHTDGKSNFSRISYKNHGFTKPNLVGYIESHDEERVMFKSLESGNSGIDYRIKELNTALNRMKLAAAFFITVPGPKMIWQFGELGYDYSIDYNGRVGNKPIRWDYLDNINRQNLYKTYSSLNYLKNNYEVFRSGNVSLSVSGSIKRIQLNHESMDVTIVGNFDVIEKTIIPGFQNVGKWYDYFSGDSIDISTTSYSMKLVPGEFFIYTTEKLFTPEIGILLGTDDDYLAILNDFKLNQNYPNPFNPSTTISYVVPKLKKNNSSLVQLKIYDTLGSEVITLVNQYQTSGNYEITFDGNKMSSGVYYYRIQVGDPFAKSEEGFIDTKKMIFLK